jgi:hypothetical protein
MIHRFKHYNRNIGVRGTLINLLVIGYLLWILFGKGLDPIGLAIGGLLLGAAALPRLFLDKLVANPERTSRVLNIGTILVVIVFALNFAGVWSPPGYSLLAIPLIIGLLIGANFWLFSDPRILTPQGMAHYTAYADTYAQPQTNEQTPHESPNFDEPMAR